MKSNLLYIWQLPQNLLGLFVILFTQAKNRNGQYNQIWISDKYGFGVSLGKYIIFGGIPSQTDIQHEQGHQKQSLYLGWFYLLIIGVPSVCGNLFDRIAHRKWTYQQRINWYYRQPWEHWADVLGNVKRGQKSL